MNNPRFLGLKQVKTAGNLVLSWLMSNNQFTSLSTLDIPGADGEFTNGLKWYRFDLNPTTTGQSFVFGEGKSFQIQITRICSFFDSVGPAFYLAGRVVVFIEGSGQTFIFGPKQVQAGSLASINGFTPIETLNVISEVSIPESTNIRVYIEQDASTGPVIDAPSACVLLQVANFHLESLSA